MVKMRSFAELNLLFRTYFHPIYLRKNKIKKRNQTKRVLIFGHLLKKIDSRAKSSTEFALKMGVREN